MPETEKRAGRLVRGALAGLVLSVNGALATLLLLWSCCGGVEFASNIGSPYFWSTLSTAAVAILSVPPVSERVRRTPARWLAVPFVIGAGFYLLHAMELATEVGAWYLGVVASVAVCTLYVLVRIVAWPTPLRAQGKTVDR